LQNSEKALDVEVWRGNSAGGGFSSYSVPARESQTVLDVVTWIQHNLEPKLAYRFACRVGMCGSCAMMVNGKPRWTCRTHVQKVAENNSLKIEPLRNMPVIKDLAADMSEFFGKWREADAVFHPTATRDDPIAPILPSEPERIIASEAIECINCAICYAACDVVALNQAFLGPAALNRTWTLVNDTRDGAGVERLRAVSGGGGCHNCHSQQSCMTYCPNELNPAASIAGLKRTTAKAVLKGEI
jgi:fumarate reductase iron-sulfur subunit